MINKNSKLIYNKKYLVIVSYTNKDLLKAFEYSFENVLYIKNSIDDINNTIKFINKNNFKQLIFVDYINYYDEIINSLNSTSEIKFIFTKSLGSLSDENIYNSFCEIFNKYKSGLVSSIAFLDKCFYEVLNEKYTNIYPLFLDIEKSKLTYENHLNTIGILNSDSNPCHSFYNELSAVKLLNKYKVKILQPTKITKSFIKLFHIKKKYVNSHSKLIANNSVNLYINFTSNNPLTFIESMDCGVPCILGNNEVINDNKLLTDLLVVKSDDNINEIANKISYVIENRNQIFKEYKEFRKKYEIESQKSITNFLNIKPIKKIERNYEKLISVIVPVYNTEKYLKKSLESIIDAVFEEDSEILIINDGSTDNSEQIILHYKELYPDLIRYIKQENHGLGNVRNVGIKEAKGKYIASIDSDDTIDENFFIDTISYLEDDVDIVICDWMTVTNDCEYETPALDPVFNNLNLYKGLLYTTIMPSTCNKIIKKSLFDNLNIKYIEDKYEDLSTNPFIMLSAETIKYIRKPYYRYYIRSNSIMRSSAGYSMIDIIKELDNRINQYNKIFNIDINEFKYYTYSWRIEEFIMNQLYTISEEELDKYIKYIYDNLYNTIIDIFNSSYYEKMLDMIKNKQNKTFIEQRNTEFKNKNIKKFIDKCRKTNQFYKLTPVIMLYGDNND